MPTLIVSVPVPFVPKEPLDFPDKLAALCWSFVDTLTADKAAPYVKRRNLVCLVKVSVSLVRITEH